MHLATNLKEIHDALYRGDAGHITMRDLEVYRDHYAQLATLLNVSGPQFKPSFEYAIKQYHLAYDIIQARLDQ